MNKNAFSWLLKWYYDHCDGDWEHGQGIHIDSMDNPGWSISINLEDTELQNKPFQKIDKESSDHNWFVCFIKNNKFEGRCGPVNLPEVLEIFKNWAEN